MNAATDQPAAVPGTSGTAVIIGGTEFDFEIGLQVDYGTGDVFWDQMTDTTRQMIPTRGAVLCVMGMVPFESIGYSDLANLPYSANPIPGNDYPKPNSLANGSVFAVRTWRSRKLVKVQVLRSAQQSDHSLQIRWETCVRPVLYLSVKVTMGSAPAWLVTRYAVECTYNTPSGTQECGKAVYGPGGGVLEGQVSDEGGAFPPNVLVTVTLDFEPGTGLAGLVKNFTPPVTDTGVNFFFEPYQVIQKTDLIFDLQPTPIPADYLLLKWKHIVSETVVTSGQKLLSSDDLRQQALTQYEIVFVPDPISAKSINIDIEGRYQNQMLPLFSQIYELSDKAVLIRAMQDPPGSGYRLVST